MASMQKIILSTVLVSMILIALLPSPSLGGHSKIRIHVPIKTHTHYHTKTILKTVHVPVKTKNHHHYLEEDDDISWSKSYPKKKKIRPVFY